VDALKPSLRPVLAAGWSCVVLVAIWGIESKLQQTTLIFGAFGVLLSSLAISKYVLGLSFTTGPMLYLTLLGLFHLGLVVPWAAGLYDISKAPWFSPHRLSPALILIIYAILAFESGVLVGFTIHPQPEKPFDGEDSKLRDEGVFAVGMVLVAAAMTMFVFGLIRLDPLNYYRLIYSEVFRLEAETDPRFFGSGITVALIGLCLAVAGSSNRQVRLTFLSTGIWVSMLFYFGFRGPALIAGLMVYAVALKKNVAFPRFLPWAAAAFLFFAIPVQRVLREQPLNDRPFFGSLDGISVLDAPAEMGGSIRPLIETADVIRRGNYRYGKTYLIGLKEIVPNLARRWKPSSNESIDDLSPSNWITAVADPWSYKNYGGMGFSAVAEPYMNLGTPGVVVFFLGLGYMLVWLERASIRSSARLASWALILGSLLWTTRNDFASFFRPVAWGVLCVGLARIYDRHILIFRFQRQRQTASKP
jgi:O-antigen polysaccharide polymerase Wzy